MRASAMSPNFPRAMCVLQGKPDVALGPANGFKLDLLSISAVDFIIWILFPEPGRSLLIRLLVCRLHISFRRLNGVRMPVVVGRFLALSVNEEGAFDEGLVLGGGGE